MGEVQVESRRIPLSNLLDFNGVGPGGWAPTEGKVWGENFWNIQLKMQFCEFFIAKNYTCGPKPASGRLGAVDAKRTGVEH